ncbi:MAG: hypothetical protein IT480_17210 [Gammaproteobacteria bacterium]|nr:hypothetical protein [Gammaproteobacteria bacterium]
MNEPSMDEVGEDFARCWAAAGGHLEQQMSGSDAAWMRSHLAPPFLEHISFRVGNRLVFVRLEDVDARLAVPGTLDDLLRIAAACAGTACLMPMRNVAGEWVPAEPGWGLIDAQTHGAVNPPDLVTSEPVEMTVWELQDLAVQVVLRRLEQQGHPVISWQSDPDVHPSIWFAGESGLEWVVVGFARYPRRDAYPPADMDGIARQYAAQAARGHFASVGIASAGEAEGGSPDGEPLPLLRGRPLMVAFGSLAEHQPRADQQEPVS